MRLLAAIILAALTLALAACRGDATPTATPTASATAIATVAPTSTGAASSTPTARATVAPSAGQSYRDAAYQVEGQVVELKGGAAEIEAAPGSASKVVTRIFGNEATGDLNRDGLEDVAFVLTQSRGGSGTFYYAVAAVRTATGWTGTNAVLLGDRIAPQSTYYEAGRVTFAYAERRPGEPMTTQPSVGVSKTFLIEDGRLVERP